MKTFCFDLLCYLSDAPTIDAMIRKCDWTIIEADRKNLPREIGQPEIAVKLSYVVQADTV